MSLYMFRALNTHLQDHTLYTQFERKLTQTVYTVYRPEDGHLRLETCRGT